MTHPYLTAEGRANKIELIMKKEDEINKKMMQIEKKEAEKLEKIKK